MSKEITLRVTNTRGTESRFRSESQFSICKLDRVSQDTFFALGQTNDLAKNQNASSTFKLTGQATNGIARFTITDLNT